MRGVGGRGQCERREAGWAALGWAGPGPHPCPMPGSGLQGSQEDFGGQKATHEGEWQGKRSSLVRDEVRGW